MSLTRCPGCGASLEATDGPTHAYIGASGACWALFGELSVRALADPVARPIWPLAVDTYAVQHPGLPERRSSQSVWVHLVSLCLVLEHGRSPDAAIRDKQGLLDQQRTWSWLEPPDEPGRLTVVDVAAADESKLAGAVREWAEAVWDAWSAHHDAVRERTRRLFDER